LLPTPMKRLAFLLALMCLCTGAAAQWTPVMVDQMVITYIDRATVRGRGSMVRMWWLMDYQLVQIVDEKGYFSRVHHSEFDCRRQRTRLLSVALLSQQMGLGEVVFEDTAPRRWESVTGQPFQRALFDIACISY
jgi:hypothetical protein